MKKLVAGLLTLAALIGGAGCAGPATATAPGPTPETAGFPCPPGHTLASSQEVGWTIGSSAADSAR